MEHGSNWASWKHSWSQRNLMLCQCSSSLRVGVLLACDLLMNFFPALCAPAAAAFAAPGPAPQAASLSMLPQMPLMHIRPHHAISFHLVHLRTGESPLERPVSMWPGEITLVPDKFPEFPQLFSLCSCPMPIHPGRRVPGWCSWASLH